MMTSEQPLVSIVILTYDNRAFIVECLQCAIDQTYHSLEIIVVDQASGDGTRDLVRQDFPQVRLIQNDRNTGFAAGMNRGICASTGEYVFLLNSDFFLEPAFVSNAVEQFRTIADDRLGMLASIVYKYCDGERTTEVDCLGFLLLPYHTVVSSEKLDALEWVLGPAGSAMFLRRAMLEDVRLPTGDYLDSTYFCYGEDIELALRAQVLGWRCLYVPVVAGWHIGSASADMQTRYHKRPYSLRVHALKNRYLTLLTCYPLCLLLWTLPWNVLCDAGQIVAYIVTCRWDSLRCLLDAYRSVACLLPKMLAKRRWVQERRRVSCAYLRSLFAKQGVLRILQSLRQKI